MLMQNMDQMSVSSIFKDFVVIDGWWKAHSSQFHRETITISDETLKSISTSYIHVHCAESTNGNVTSFKFKILKLATY